MTKSGTTDIWGAAWAVILAGGSGTRLWPMSRSLLPKQLLALNGEATLLQQTAQRLLGRLPAERIITVTNEEHYFEVCSQLAELQPDLTGQVLKEPMARNTLPAILLGLDRIVAAQNPDLGQPLVGIFPSDHMIGDQARFESDWEKGLQLAQQDWFVTFGIPPTKPETGYGYIAKAKKLAPGAFEVAGFVEKPPIETAREFVAGGSHSWNSGMFIVPGMTFLKAVETHQPRLWSWWQEREGRGLVSGYAEIPDISVDYGIMEHAERLAMVEAGFSWDDLGSWEAMFRMGQKDAVDHCVVKGDVLAMDCRESLLISNGGKLAAVGLEGLAVVQTRDATLVCPLDQVQRVKDVVNRLKAEKSTLVEAHVTVRRPWGSYTVLEEERFYKIKRIMVHPGARLSLQMHHHRSEHWVVIKGTAQVQVGDKEMLVVENQSVDIPKTTLHRLSNPGRVPVEIIEIQSGPYLEEDDIVRFDDVYGRNQPRET
ncbi:mannose-1-phosphate guanylyltransferase/mannose-6-phosphate isomerase [Desulfonatronum thioautotrophicum]|uniref:mannose-1-phosphate guanylyltransferase/mannose-6-phosphate isomerase n=1 Tax=Desulfonatronum thioautotrophicum TaxID=617001 RepID=UPI0005EB9896|nr:mannose-1-phosphate guanylyltransferase/mannose-6-phosphate isomerase [Desulfonatronum thioautotrophicum]